MSRSLLAALVAASVAIMPAAAWAQDGPTLSFDKPCYSPGDRMTFTGAGFTPGGPVQLIFTSLSTQLMLGTYDVTADEGGAIADWVDTPDPDDALKPEHWSGPLGVAANDQIRIEAGGPPEQQLAGASFTLSRWEVQLDLPNDTPKVRAAKPMRVTAVGFTHAIGKPLYIHYTRAGKRLKSIRLGRLTGDCGDRTKTLKRGLPRGLRRGRYKLVFNASALNAPREPSYWINQRLR